MNEQHVNMLEERQNAATDYTAVPEAPIALGDALQLIRLDALADAAAYLNEVVVRFGGE